MMWTFPEALAVHLSCALPRGPTARTITTADIRVVVKSRRVKLFCAAPFGRLVAYRLYLVVDEKSWSKKKKGRLESDHYSVIWFFGKKLCACCVKEMNNDREGTFLKIFIEKYCIFISINFVL